MAVFTEKPSFTPVSTRRPRVLSTRFGDGYEQRGRDGINSDLMSWQLVFQHLPTADATAVEAFLAPLGGVDIFQWTPPGGAQGNYICRTWTRTMSGPISDTIQATFEEVPDVVV